MRWVTLRVKIPLKLFILAPFLVLEMALLVAYHYFADGRPTIVFAATVAGAAFGLNSYLTAIGDRRATVSSRFMERWNDPSFTEVRATVRKLLRDEVSLSEIMQNGKLSPEAARLRDCVIAECNFFEEMAITVLDRRADEDALFRFFRKTVVFTYHKLKDWIEHERKLWAVDEFFENFGQLTSRWETIYKRQKK
jgi:hypothetical protein